MTFRDKMYALVVAVFWGGNFLAIHIGLEHFPPLLLASLRFVVIAVPTVLFVPRPKVRWRWLIGYGLGFGTAQFAFMFLAMAHGLPVGLASLIAQASAPFTVLLGALLLRERPTRRQVVAVSFAIGGLVAIAVARSAVAPVLPLALGLLAALSWAIGNVCGRKAEADDPPRFLLWMSLVPPLPLFALSWFVEGPDAIGAAFAALTTPAGLPGLAALAYLVVFATLIGQLLWTALLARYPAGTVAPYSMLVPVVGLATAAVVLGERPSWIELVGGAVIVGGVLYGTPRRVSPAHPRRRIASWDAAQVTEPVACAASQRPMRRRETALGWSRGGRRSFAPLPEGFWWTKASARSGPESTWPGTPACSPGCTTRCSPATNCRPNRVTWCNGPGSGPGARG